MKKYKVKLKWDFITTLDKMMDDLLKSPLTDTSPVNKMYLSIIAEIKSMVHNKLEWWKPEFKLSLTPAQAFALQMFCQKNSKDPSNYMSNRMLQISNEIHQLFS